MRVFTGILISNFHIINFLILYESWHLVPENLNLLYRRYWVDLFIYCIIPYLRHDPRISILSRWVYIRILRKALILGRDLVLEQLFQKKLAKFSVFDLMDFILDKILILDGPK